MAGFQSLADEFHKERVKVITGSVDTAEKTKEFLDKLGVTFPAAYGMDAESVSQMTGAFYDEQRKIIQPTGLLVRPDKTIEVAVYSSGPVGRFVAKDVLALVKFYKSRQKS